VHSYCLSVRNHLPLDHVFHEDMLKEEYRQLIELGQKLQRSFESKLMQVQSLYDKISVHDNSWLERLPLQFASVHNQSLSSVQDLACMTKEIQHFFVVFRQQLSDALVYRDTCEHEDTRGHSRYFPGDYRRQLYDQAVSWNTRLSVSGNLLSWLKEQCFTSSCDSKVDTPDTIMLEIQRLLRVREEAIGGAARMYEDLEDMIVEDNDNIDALNFLDSYSSENTPAAAPLYHPGKASPTSDLSRMHSSSGGVSDHSAHSHCMDSGLAGNKGVAMFRNSEATDLVMKRLRHCDGTVVPCSNVVEKPIDARRRDRIHTASMGKRSSKLSHAIARLMGKDYPEQDHWTVCLDELGSRYRVTVGDQGDVVPVHEVQITAVIAYSLNTEEYKRTLATYLKSYVNEISHVNVPQGITGICGKFDCTVESNPQGSHTFNRVKDSSDQIDVRPESLCRTCNETNGTSCLASKVCSNQLPPLERPEVNCTGPFLQPKVIPDRRATACFHLAVGFETLDDMAWKNEVCNGTSHVNSDGLCSLEQQLLSQHESHIKHRFADVDENGNVLCKFICQSFWAIQFAAVRKAYIGMHADEEFGYLRSLSMSRPWNAQGGKSGATFLKTVDGRFVVKHITRTELQMFLESALAYFEYLSKALFQKSASLLIKVLGVYQIGSHNRVSGRRTMDHVVVMENLFYDRAIAHAFDLKGSARSRYAQASFPAQEGSVLVATSSVDSCPRQPRKPTNHQVLLDDNFVEYMGGRPLPLRDEAKAYFNHAVLNDTLFLSLINVVDYSILVGIDEDKRELVVGIIDYMRQYDMLKKMERMSKSVGMIAGQAEPTVIQPPNYRNRFQAAMERYFMMVPDKWTSFRFHQSTQWAEDPL